MTDNYGYAEEARGRHRYGATSLDIGYSQSLPPTTDGLASAYSIMGSSAGYAGANSSPYAQAMHSMQGAYGNRALQRYFGQPVGGAGYAGGSLPGSQGTSTISGIEDQQKAFTVPGDSTRMGWQHPADGDGGFAFWESEENKVSIPGVPFSIPIHDFEAGMGFDLGGETVIGGTARGGSWEAEDGSTRFGGKLDAGLAVPGLGIGLDGFKAGGEMSAGSSGFTVGAGITTVGVGGTQGEDKFSGDSNNEGFMSGGVSDGPSIGARGHWGDSDGDGYRELGFGFDLGAFSFDMKSEDPLRTLVGGIPLAPFLGPLSPTVGSALLPAAGNLTYDALGMAGGAMETLGGGLKSALDWASPLWMGESGGLDPIAPAQPDEGGGLGDFFPSWS